MALKVGLCFIGLNLTVLARKYLTREHTTEGSSMSRVSPGIAVAASIPRLVFAGAYAIGGAVGLQYGLACRYEWAILGAAILMLAWAFRWIVSVAALISGRFGRLIPAVQAGGFVGAAILFAMEYRKVQGSLQFSWWPLVVSVLFFIVAGVYLLQTVRHSSA